jgi:L-lactate dehydrogenase complex protein LldE
MPEQAHHTNSPPPPVVGLLVTCLADLFRPSVAFSALELLQRAGCEVVVPGQQTCCGQPEYNSGDSASAEALARQTIEQFEFADFVVIPSGSCAGMIVKHYPELLQGQWRERALALADRTYELTTFLTEICPLPSDYRLPNIDQPVAYHDSCAGLRELGIRPQPRALLRKHCDIDVLELAEPDVCCGFGGTFCTKMPEISAKMVTDKLNDALATGAPVLTGGDLGCLMNIAGRASRLGHQVEIRHVAEILNGDTNTPAIGEGRKT